MIRRVLFWCVVVAALVYAVQGGEWGTDDLLAQRARAARLRSQIDSLRHEVDSLARVKKAIQTDPAVQERIAREEFGMVRGDKELLYRFTIQPDSARRPSPLRP
jgi:cell division protein FtsB